jgi:hypothetical protein
MTDAEITEDESSDSPATHTDTWEGRKTRRTFAEAYAHCKNPGRREESSVTQEGLNQAKTERRGYGWYVEIFSRKVGRKRGID